MPKLKKKKRRTSRLETVIKEKEPKVVSPSQKSSYEKSYEEFLNDLFTKTEQTTMTLRDWLNWTYLQTHGAISSLVTRKKRRLDWEFAQDFWTEHARMLGVPGTTDTDGSVREHKRAIETARGYISEKQTRPTITSLFAQWNRQAQQEKRRNASDFFYKPATTTKRIEEYRDIVPSPNVSEELADIVEGESSRPPTRPITKLERLFGKEPTEKITDRFPSKRQTCAEIENSLRRLGIQTTLCDRGVRRLIGKT